MSGEDESGRTAAKPAWGRSEDTAGSKTKPRLEVGQHRRTCRVNHCVEDLLFTLQAVKIFYFELTLA